MYRNQKLEKGFFKSDIKKLERRNHTSTSKHNLQKFDEVITFQTCNNI